MNILFLTHRIPFPPDKGEKIRAFHVLRHLMRRHVVHLGAFVDDPADLYHAAALRDFVNGECHLTVLRRPVAMARMALAILAGKPLTTSYFAGGEMRRWVSGMLKRRPMDRVLLFSSAMAPFFLNGNEYDPARVVLDMVDVDSDKWAQYARAANVPKSWLFARESRLLLALERRAAATFGASLLVSPFEAHTFAGLAPESRARIYCAANGVDLERNSPLHSFNNPYPLAEMPIVMVGTMDYRPNVEGAMWFAQNVLRSVRARLPMVRFYIVGAKPAAQLNAFGSGVVVTGKVDDVRPYLAHAAAVVAPLRMARGVQNKVLEGLAMRKPVVATVAASRGLNVVPGRDLWVEDEPLRFAEAVIAAAVGADRQTIAENGRRVVEQQYDWTTTLGVLERILEMPPRTEVHRSVRDWQAVPLGESAE